MFTLAWLGGRAKRLGCLFSLLGALSASASAQRIERVFDPTPADRARSTNLQERGGECRRRQERVVGYFVAGGFVFGFSMVLLATDSGVHWKAGAIGAGLGLLVSLPIVARMCDGRA